MDKVILQGTINTPQTVKGVVNIPQTVRGTISIPELIKGDPGESAYEIAVRNGFEGTEVEWLESLHSFDILDGGDASDFALGGGT